MSSLMDLCHTSIHKYTNTRPGEVCVDQAPIKCSFGCQRKETKKFGSQYLIQIFCPKQKKCRKLTSRDKKGASVGSQGPWLVGSQGPWLAPMGLGRLLAPLPRYHTLLAPGVDLCQTAIHTVLSTLSKKYTL